VSVLQTVHVPKAAKKIESRQHVKKPTRMSAIADRARTRALQKASKRLQRRWSGTRCKVDSFAPIVPDASDLVESMSF
jgi:hypothetical protein